MDLRAAVSVYDAPRRFPIDFHTAAAAFTDGSGDWWMRLRSPLVKHWCRCGPGRDVAIPLPRDHKGAIHLNSIQITATTDSALPQDPADELVPIR